MWIRTIAVGGTSDSPLKELRVEAGEKKKKKKTRKIKMEKVCKVKKKTHQ